MARQEVLLTGAYQSIATGRCVVTVSNVDNAGRMISLNEAASDTAAHVEKAVAGHQFVQNENTNTYAKGAGVTIIVDSE